MGRRSGSCRTKSDVIYGTGHLDQTFGAFSSMMTPDEYRRLALSLPEAVEGEHMNHPDFRVRNRIFATLWPNQNRGVVKLTSDQ
jgi:hypothetical protein